MNEDLSQMIGKIMSDPAFGNLVTQLKSSGIAEEKAPQKEPSPEEIAGKLPDVVEMLAKSNLNLSGNDSEKIGKALSSLRKLDNRNCEKLLSALKPYLRNERGEIIDKAVSMLKITDILSVLQQTDPDKKES